MGNDNSEFINSVLRKLSKVNYIKPGDVPNIDLYMDQVTTFMDAHLSDIKRYEDDKILTKTMINNYTKNDLLPPPVKKKYSKDHLYVLAFIYYFKNILSISDIQTLLQPISHDFFGDDKAPSLDAIYKEIFKLEKEQMSSMSKDVYQKFRHSEKSFDNMTDGEQKKFLQMFTFVCLLSFDVYMKKNIIENIIDEMVNSKSSTGNTGNKKDKVKEPAKDMKDSK